MQPIAPPLHLRGHDLGRVLPPDEPEEVGHRPGVSPPGRRRHRLIDEGGGRTRVKLQRGDFPCARDFGGSSSTDNV